MGSSFEAEQAKIESNEKKQSKRRRMDVRFAPGSRCAPGSDGGTGWVWRRPRGSRGRAEQPLDLRDPLGPPLAAARGSRAEIQARVVPSRTLWVMVSSTDMAPFEGSPPMRIDRYELYGVIASGGMATVHLGRLVGPAGFGKTVAIKRLHPHLAKEPEFVAMLTDEARVTGRIGHPNIVPTLDVVAARGELFLVMEYVPGLTLAQLVKNAATEGERVPLPIACTIMASVLRGLDAAHEARDESSRPLEIVHRDVSPQNILVGADGVARLLDFGIAKAVGRLHTTRDSQLKGKVGYMAPEQIGQRTVDRRTDVYAASVVLWEVLTGERLFDGADAAAIFGSVMQKKVPAPSTDRRGRAGGARFCRSLRARARTEPAVFARARHGGGHRERSAARASVGGRGVGRVDGRTRAHRARRNRNRRWSDGARFRATWRLRSRGSDGIPPMVGEASCPTAVEKAGGVDRRRRGRRASRSAPVASPRPKRLAAPPAAPQTVAAGTALPELAAPLPPSHGPRHPSARPRLPGPRARARQRRRSRRPARARTLLHALRRPNLARPNRRPATRPTRSTSKDTSTTRSIAFSRSRGHVFALRCRYLVTRIGQRRVEVGVLCMRARIAGYLLAASLAGPSAARADDKLACVQAADTAQDHRTAGRLKEARTSLHACARAACPALVRGDCTRWLSEVEASMPTIVIRAIGPRDEDLTEVQVDLDGRRFAEKLEGFPLEIDPGPHVFTGRTAAGPIARQEIVVRTAEKNRTVTLRVETGRAAPASESSAPASASTAEPFRPGAAAWILAGVAVAGATSFAYFGLRGSAEVDDMRSECAGHLSIERCGCRAPEASRGRYFARRGRRFGGHRDVPFLARRNARSQAAARGARSDRRPADRRGRRRLARAFLNEP